MRRVVLDTNVVVSALLFRGTTSELHALWKRSAFTALVSDATISELARVLAYPKFRLTGDTIAGLLAAEVLPFTERVEPARSPAACRDPDDDEFLWTARDGRAEMLVTGDPDLLALRPIWEGVRIVTVAEALTELR